MDRGVIIFVAVMISIFTIIIFMQKMGWDTGRFSPEHNGEKEDHTARYTAASAKAKEWDGVCFKDIPASYTRGWKSLLDAEHAAIEVGNVAALLCNIGRTYKGSKFLDDLTQYWRLILAELIAGRLPPRYQAIKYEMQANMSDIKIRIGESIAHDQYDLIKEYGLLEAAIESSKNINPHVGNPDSVKKNATKRDAAGDPFE